jgi:hypothetical protein
MKTQLVHLETHDDLISIRDKMAWAKTPRILLVWPRNQPVDVRPLDLQLLRRHARSLGAELGLVTHDSQMRAAARRMDLPVFSTASEAQRRRWPARTPARTRRRARPNLRAVRDHLPGIERFDEDLQPAARLAIFAAGVLAVLVVVLVFIPSAEIRMSAPTRPQSVEIAVSAETTATHPALSGIVPSRELTYAVSETDSMLASGQIVSPDQIAQGEVHLGNLGGTKVVVPSGTVVLTAAVPPARFVTVNPAEVPAGTGLGVDVPVRALAAGSGGNVPAGAITAFEGPLGLSLSVTNPFPTSGGTDVTSAAPTDADRASLRERLLAKINKDARAELPSHVRGGDVLFPTSFSFSKVLTETFTPASNQPDGKLSLTLRAEFHARYAAAADLDQLAAQVLDASLPAGYEPLPDTLSIVPDTPLFGGGDGNMRWHARAQRTLRVRIEPEQVVRLAAGKTAAGAGSLLQSTFGLENAPQISIQPFFWPWLPALPFRITVAG